MTFAVDTAVPVERSRAEIERLLMKYGASSFATGWDQGSASILFDYRARRVRFTLPLPLVTDPSFRLDAAKRARRPDAIRRAHDQVVRSRWRALLLVIKARLEAVEAGVETFEVAFLAHLVLPNGETMGDWAVPRIAAAYANGVTMPPLLGAGST